MRRSTKYQFPFAKYPAVRLALLFSAGIIFNSYIQLSLWVWLLLLFLSVIMYGIIEHQYRYGVNRALYSMVVTCYLSTVFIFGGFWHSFHIGKPNYSAEIFQAYEWEELTFHGEVYAINQASSGKYQIDMAVDTTIFETSEIWTNAFNMRALMNPGDNKIAEKLTLGDRLVINAIIYPLEGKRNPHEFDYKQYLGSKEIYVQSGIQSVISHAKERKHFTWNIIRQRVLDAIDNNFKPEIRPLAKALLIGYKNELKREDKIAFSRAGLSHIMAVSGLHVGFILAPFWLVIPFFWTFRYGKQIGMLLLVLILFFYAGLTGFSASVSRASLVGGFLVYGRLFHKIRDSKNLTAVAAVIILLINPADIFDIGFQLSFTAVYIILLTSPTITRYLPPRIRFSWYGMPVMVIIISLLVQAGLFPLLVYYFDEFSIAGPIANAVVIPFLTFAVPVALFLLPVAIIFPAISQILNMPVQLFLESLLYFVKWTSALEWSWIQVNQSSPFFFLIWLFAIFSIAAWTIPNLRWKYVAGFLFVLCLYQGQLLIEKISGPKLEVTVFDVGQGDAALISTPNDKHFLIDTGRWTPTYNSAKYVIIPHLKTEGISRLDAIFHSHPHADHIGGTSELMDHFPIDTIYNAGAHYDSKLYHDYLRKAERKKIPVKSLSAGDIVNIDPSMQIFVYGPSDGGKISNINNSSLILELVYKSTEFLFMGDAESKQEHRLLENYPAFIETDFLKVAHHGSKTSSNNHLLKSAAPGIATISLAKTNRFKHPHPDAVYRLQQTKSELYFTSLEGALKFESDGTTIHRIPWK